MMRSKFLASITSVLILPLCSAFAVSVNQLVDFGDSLSDAGNVNFLTGGQLPGSNYANGRFTDGTNTTPSTTSPLGNWIDQLAPKLGVADPSPGYIPLSGGTNYAVGGADTGSNSLYFVSDQIGLYLANSGGKASSTALFTIWAGSNDILDSKNPVTAADNIYQNILTLSGAGAKYFLWPNLAPLGQTPSGLGSGQSAALNAAALAFNAEYAIDLAKLQALGIQVFGMDVATLFNQIEASPTAYGFTNVTQPAQGQAGVNPNTYLFWDGLHPTTAGDALLASLAYSDLTGSTTATPEPGTVGIAFVTIAGLGLACVRKRKTN